MVAALVRWIIVSGANLLTGVRAVWCSWGPSADQTVYFANHSSHGDFVLLWATLPADLRNFTRPVAGEDYWNRSPLRRFIGSDVFNALMIPRETRTGCLTSGDSLARMSAALKAGDSLIIFPEGTRNTGDAVLLPLKSGIYHLSQSFSHVKFVPVWIENLKRVLPKGTFLPIPLACSVRFGAPLKLELQEDKKLFLQRARQALLDLRPEYDREAELPSSCTAQVTDEPEADA
ncbi:lysophospholipid acyltransferase family protein [Hydrogenophaga soli]